MSINVKKYTKDQMAKMVEEAQAKAEEAIAYEEQWRVQVGDLKLQINTLKAKNATLVEQLDQMNGEAINRANEIANLKADADALRNKLGDTEEALGRANAEITYSVTEKSELNAKIKQLDGERHYYKSRSDELDHYKNLLTNANEESARIQGKLEKVCCGRAVAEQRANYAEAHPWRNLREWAKRKLVRHK